MNIDNLPRAAMSREEARRRTDKFKAHTEAWLEELAALYIDQVWWALGYENWNEYCRAEFGSIRLPRAERDQAVRNLREANLSERAIASGLGIGLGTVHRALEAGGDPVEVGDFILSADGSYQLKRPPTPEIEPGVPLGTPTPEIDVPIVPEIPESEPVEPEPIPEPEPVPEPEPEPIPELKPVVSEPGPTPTPEPVEPGPEPTPLQTIDELLAELGSVVTKLEQRTKADDFVDPRKKRQYPFTVGAYKLIDGPLHERLEEISGQFAFAETMREIWPMFTKSEKRRWAEAFEADGYHEAEEVVDEVVVSVYRRDPDQDTEWHMAGHYEWVRIDSLDRHDPNHPEEKRRRREQERREWLAKHGQ